MDTQMMEQHLGNGHKAIVLPQLTTNLYLDGTLKLLRGPDGVELYPKEGMGSGDGYVHFSVITTVGEEAAWWAIGNDHAVPAHVSVELMRPARVDKGVIIGIGQCLRAGKNVMVSEGTVMQGMDLIAKVTATFVHFVKR